MNIIKTQTIKEFILPSGLLLILLCGCAQSYVPSDSMKLKASSMSHEDARKIFNESISIPHYYPTFSNTISIKLYNGEVDWFYDEDSVLSIEDDSFTFKNIHTKGKYLGKALDENGNQKYTYDGLELLLYEKIDYSPPSIRIDEVNTIIKMEHIYNSYCADHSNFYLLKLSYPFNLSVCVSDIESFYASVLKLMPNSEIREWQ